MATLDQVKLLIQADAKGLSAGLNKATGELKNFGGMAQRTFSGINSTFAALGVTLSAGAIGIGLKNIVNGLEELSVSSQKTGIAVEDLAKLRYAFEQADVPVESLNKALRFLNRTIGEARAGNRCFK